MHLRSIAVVFAIPLFLMSMVGCGGKTDPTEYMTGKWEADKDVIRNFYLEKWTAEGLMDNARDEEFYRNRLDQHLKTMSFTIEFHSDGNFDLVMDSFDETITGKGTWTAAESSEDQCLLTLIHVENGRSLTEIINVSIVDENAFLMYSDVFARAGYRKNDLPRFVRSFY